jgi:HD-GYP domain-containing protein (c-di-GMP phosphodiesterase class II)
MSKTLADHLIALKADRLRPGMFVAALDRLWLHTPFPPGGFFVRDTKLIARIGRYCTYVYIDPLKSEEPDDVVVPFEPITAAALAPLVNQHDIGEELPWARQALGALHEAVQRMMREVRTGRLPDTDALNTGLAPVVDSVQRCPDALLWLMRTEPLQGYLYRRAIGTAVIATAFGYRLGFDQESLMELALGGLLMDIGKLEVPVTLLAKADMLSPLEHGLVRRHVCHALDMVRVMDSVPERVVDMVSSHHERFDGSGYPQKQRGTEIPLFARIAGIVDTFDAITQERRYAPAISAHTALRYLNGQRRSKFDGALMQEFIHAMGIYPTGTWVELLDGSIGVVCSQDARWPLAPRVAVTKNSQGVNIEPRMVLASRMNPIINARHTAETGLLAPDLEAIA